MLFDYDPAADFRQYAQACYGEDWQRIPEKQLKETEQAFLCGMLQAMSWVLKVETRLTEIGSLRPDRSQKGITDASQ